MTADRAGVLKLYSDEERRDSLNRPRPTIYPIRTLPLISNSVAFIARKVL
jgi:hypothetical protein